MASPIAVAKPSYTSMRGLQAFIKDIRQCKSKEAEQKRVSKELNHILQQFKDLKKQKKANGKEGYQRTKYICKLVFIHLLGAEVDFGYLEAVELVGSNRLTEKQMGYLACTVLSPSEDNDVVLLVAKIKKDLVDPQPYVSALALDCVGCTATKEICDATAESIMKVLVGRSTNAAIKKAALVLLRLHRQSPGLMDRLFEGKRRSNVIELLEHRDMGIVTAAATLLAVLADESPEPYQACIEKAVNTLSTIRDTATTGNTYTYKGTLAPWTTVKLLQLLQCFPLPENPTLQDRIKSVIGPMIKRQESESSGKKKSVNTINGRNMVLFEALNLVINYELDTRDLFVQAVSVVGSYISAKEINFRYLGLSTMSELAKTEITKVSMARHETVIFERLKDKDVSIRQRALSLLYNMCNAENCERIVTELLAYLVTADYGSREELVLVIAILAEIPFESETEDRQKMAAAEKWYVDVILKLLNLAGDYVSVEVWYRVLHIIVSTEHDEIQDYATKVVFEMVQEPTCHETAIKVAGYVLGEFGHLIANDPQTLPELQFRSLYAHYPYVSNATRQLLLTSFVKLRNLFAEIKPMVDTVLRNTRQSANSDPEIQQRSIEYFHLSSKASDVLLEKVLDEMPAFSKTKMKTSKLVQLLDKKAAYGRGGKQKKRRPQASGTKTNGTAGTAPPSDAPRSRSATSSSLVDVETPSDIFTAPPKIVGGTSVIERVAADDNGVVAKARGFASNNSGVLYQDDVIQIGLKSQWKGNKGKIELFLGNKSTTTPFVNTVINISQVRGLSCIAYVQGIAPELEAGSQTPIAYLVECTDVFAGEPSLALSFRFQSQLYKYNLKLPVYMTNFMSGVQLTKEAFITKWQQLGAPELEMKSVFDSKEGVSSQLAKKVLTGLNLQVLEGVEPNPQNVVCAGLLATEGGPVGLLVRVEPNPQMNMYRATVRSSKEPVTIALSDILQWAL